MVRDALPVALLVVVALLAVTNPVWLFPSEGSVQYTYERSEISAENGVLTYDGDSGADYQFANDLAGVDCEAYDEPGRVCAFDRALARDGPVTLDTDETYSGTPDFTRVGDDYYRRLTYGNSSATTYDVERVTPRELLRAAASNATADPAALSAAASLQYRAVVTGDPQRRLTYRDDDVGSVWYRDGTYYTVVVTDESALDRPFVSPTTRDGLSLAGLVVLVVVPLRAAGRLDRLR